MTKKIALLVDSGMDVPTPVIEKGGVYVVPLNIMYQSEIYLDKIDISAKEVYDRLDEEIPKTSLPSIPFIEKTIEKIIEDGYTDLICITISSGLSGTHNALRLMLEDWQDRLPSAIVDTKSIGIGGGVQGAYAKDLIDSGLDFDTIVTKLKDIQPYGRVFFSIPTLEYLKKGGRIGLVTSILGNALNLHPLISCNEDGIYHTINKARGRKRSIKKMKDAIRDTIGSSQTVYLGVAYGTCIDDALELISELKEDFPFIETIYLDEVSPVLGVHTGPGIIGVGVLPIN